MLTFARSATPFTSSLKKRFFSTSVGSIFTPTAELAQLRTLVRDIAESEVAPQALEFDRKEQFNYPLFQRFGELGLLGLSVDEKYGGTAMGPVGVVIAHEELSAVDPAFCLSFLAHTLLFANNLHVNGNEAQKEKYLPEAVRGEKLCGMCMSEPGAGTDVPGGFLTTAKKDGSDYILNGTKMWITNGAKDDVTLGDTFLVYAKSGVKPNGRPEHSLFIAEKGMEGFSLGQRIKDKCGMRASNTAELVFEDVRIPSANLVGKEGHAMIHMMLNLEIERLGLAAMSLGIARRSIEVMNQYAKDRQAFGKSLNHYGQIQKHIADSYAEYMAGRSYVYNVANNLDLTKPGNRIDSDGVKLFCSNVATNIASRAIQVLGGYGYVGEYNVERLWRDAKLLEIGGGTTEAHEKNITKDLLNTTRLN